MGPLWPRKGKTMYRFELKRKNTKVTTLASLPFSRDIPETYGIEHDKFIDFIASKGQWYYGDSDRFELHLIDLDK